MHIGEHDHGTHTHTHSHAHTHGEGHAHTHEHTHNDVSAFESVEQATALVSYMLDHNRHHADELHDLAHKLEASGNDESAKLISEALEKFYEGNDILEKGLQLLKEGK